MTEETFSLYLKAIAEFEDSIRRLRLQSAEDGKRLLLLVDSLSQELRRDAEKLEAKIEEEIKKDADSEIEQIKRKSIQDRDNELRKINELANKNFDKAVDEVLKIILNYIKSL